MQILIKQFPNCVNEQGHFLNKNHRCFEGEVVTVGEIFSKIKLSVARCSLGLPFSRVLGHIHARKNCHCRRNLFKDQVRHCSLGLPFSRVLGYIHRLHCTYLEGGATLQLGLYLFQALFLTVMKAVFFLSFTFLCGVCSFWGIFPSCFQYIPFVLLKLSQYKLPLKKSCINNLESTKGIIFIYSKFKAMSC